MSLHAKRLPRTRFWVETALASVTAALLLLTLVSREWIELLSGVAPDGGDGSWEAAIVAGLALACGVSVVAARVEWRRSPLRAQ